MVIESDICMSGDDDKKVEEDHYHGFSTDEEDMPIDVKLDGFNIEKVIFNESSVQVYRAINCKTHEVVAIKMIDIQDQVVTKQMIREMMILDLNHENLVRLKSVQLAGTKLCFVMEFLPMDLGDYLILAPLEKIHLKQILEGVSYLHDAGIIHRDLKPENILIDNNDDKNSFALVKIADFGLARAFISAGDGLSPDVGAVGYVAPEILLGSEQYTSAVDIWAVGCIFAGSVGKKPFVDGGPAIPTLAEIFRILGIPSEEKWPGVNALPGYKAISALNLEPPIGLHAHYPDLEPTSLDLLSKLLCLEPIGRITAKEALKHDYFTGSP